VQLDVSIPGLDRQFIGVARLSVADGEMAPVASLATEEVLPGQTVDAAATTFWSWGRLRLMESPAPT